MNNIDSIRCFISIEIDTSVKENIECYIKKLANEISFKKIKWVKTDNMHITLAFLGKTPMDKIKQISAVMELVSDKLDPFIVNLKGTGFFPNDHEPKILWIGVEKSPSLYFLKKEIDTGLENIKVKFDKKPFSPHLTLGRVKESLNLHLNTLPDFQASFLVKNISLVKSELLREGPIYSNLFTCPIKKRLTH